jgi:hypothetical protein
LRGRGIVAFAAVCISLPETISSAAVRAIPCGGLGSSLRLGPGPVAQLVRAHP